MLNGTVEDKSEQPIAGAVVYLKNMKTLAVKSFFAQKDGSYRFPQLALNTDYEVYAEKDGKKSDLRRSANSTTAMLLPSTCASI